MLRSIAIVGDPMTPVVEPPRPCKPHQDFASIFDAHRVRYVRIQWVDLGNMVRCRFLPVTRFRKLLESDRPGVMLFKGTLGAAALQLAPGFNAVGEYIYVIDLSSFRLCSYAPGHAVFSGFFQELVPIAPPSGPSFEVPFCPRTVLSRIIRYATQELGIQFLVGVESEFTLLKSTRPLVPVNDHPWSTTAAATTGTVEARVLEEIADAIQTDGIELEMYHKEGGPGQYEVVTGPMSPLEAADALVHTRETVYNIASKHGLRATFAPRPIADSLGCGAHIHVSVRGGRPGTSASELLTPVESAFLAGLMHHLPSVIALTMPLAASYARMADGLFAGGTWVCWGVENREAPVRLTRATTPSSRNFEVRPVDGLSNPYLAVAGILACGAIGVRDDLALAVRDCSSSTNGTDRTAAEMTVEERDALGITTRLPMDVGEARRCLAADDAIKDVLGSELVTLFSNVSEMLVDAFARREGEEESVAMARLVESY